MKGSEATFESLKCVKKIASIEVKVYEMFKETQMGDDIQCLNEILMTFISTSMKLVGSKKGAFGFEISFIYVQLENERNIVVLRVTIHLTPNSLEYF